MKKAWFVYGEVKALNRATIAFNRLFESQYRCPRAAKWFDAWVMAAHAREDLEETREILRGIKIGERLVKSRIADRIKTR